MKYTFAELAKEARREADMRRRVYPGGHSGMTPQKARYLDMMDHIAVVLEDLAKKSDPPVNVQTDLLGGE